MSIVRVTGFTVSADGFGAGPRQDLTHPLGVRGQELMEWAFATEAWRRQHGQTGGERGVDSAMAEQWLGSVGAWIMGRNMFGPIRGPWRGEEWRGWWGEEPPYHAPVFVLTHHARPPLAMKGGTEFRFVVDGIASALTQAQEAAKGRDVGIAGGVATLQQYLRAQVVDEAHIALRPILLGAGERLWDGLDLSALGYECVAGLAGERAYHLILRRRGSPAWAAPRWWAT